MCSTASPRTRCTWTCSTGGSATERGYTRAGLCHTYREYFDRGAALLALGISPAAVARIAAVRPTVEVTEPGLAARA